VPTLPPSAAFEQLACVAAFTEVFLAKEGHGGGVGINLLSKIQLPTLPTLYGAMLAGVDTVLMGAGVPVQIPEILDRLAEGAPASLRIDVDDARPGEEFHGRFDPATFVGGTPPRLTRPTFLAIISSATLAQALLRRSKGEVDGFVVERDSAGGHNAPPRGARVLTAEGEPLYGPRDIPDLEAIRALGRPFWLAGAYGTPEGLVEALRLGAAGIQVGTAFAFCDESGVTPEIKREVIARARRGEIQVFTDPDASPTGFPFKVVQLPGSLSEAEVVASRLRVCDLGYLRQPYRRDDGSLGYRCPAEPVEDYLRKGGSLEDTVGRVCVCNGLPGVVGLAQQRAGRGPEPALLTAGNALTDVASWCPGDRDGYTAADVVARLLADSRAARGLTARPDRAPAASPAPTAPPPPSGAA
jgi:NAD(P)H-dependent flavin oxidoreductase YrpB (nitropropane dioxygenase family)